MGGKLSFFELVLVAALAAFVAVLGVVPAFYLGGSVPITLQTFGVMLVGGLLGPRLGVYSISLVVAVALLGLPVLSGGRGGIAVLLSPTGGYLLGWIPGVFVVGLLSNWWALRLERKFFRTVAVFISCFVGGVIVVYICGIPWVSWVTGVPLLYSLWSSVAFLLGDIVKAIFATLLIGYVKYNYGSLLVEEK